MARGSDSYGQSVVTDKKGTLGIILKCWHFPHDVATIVSAKATQMLINKTLTVIIFVALSLSVSACSNHERLSGSSLAMQSANPQTVSAQLKVEDSNQTDEFVLTGEMERRAGIQLTQVVSKQLNKNAVFSSSVEATTRGSAVVNSLVHGIVTRVLADVGDYVKAGQTLCYINCPEVLEAQSAYLTSEAKLQEANAQIVQVENRVQLAKLDIERIKKLNEEGIAPVKDVQASQGRLATTEAELAASKSLLSASHSYVAAAASRLQSFGIKASVVSDSNLVNELPLKSPISGVIVKKSISPGQNVNPSNTSGSTQTNSEDGLFSIVDLKKVWVMLEVPQSEVAGLKLNAPIEFTSEVAPGKTFKGNVITPGEKFDPASRTVAVRAEINNPQMILKPGMLVIANATEAVCLQSRLIVPNSALQEIEGKYFVFVKIGEHRYKKVSVSGMQSNGQSTSIEHGLKANEQVVTQGSFVLKSEALKASLGPHD
jgi:membrane fusion protein, heavy metal efflux system